ncbi:hypothetical protein H0H93_002366 [Arthromyces matolae]|nr:hypothetical protein H0H93_002366 [Arthromyces matolae]
MVFLKRVYYYFYERSRGVILKSREGGGKGMTTLESILAGLIAGSATTLISNPIWVVQTSQAVRTLNQASVDGPSIPRKLGFIQTVKNIVAKDGIQQVFLSLFIRTYILISNFRAFWRGIGPALVLVINPVLQYTVFEQMKNLLIASRTKKLRAAGAVASAVAVLSDWDFFFLGALSKLVATGSTYPYMLQAGQANALKYKSAIDGLLTILKEEGVGGLYKGIGSKLLQSVLTAAILFAGQRRIYEMTKNVCYPMTEHSLDLTKAIGSTTSCKVKEYTIT